MYNLLRGRRWHCQAARPRLLRATYFGRCPAIVIANFSVRLVFILHTGKLCVHMLAQCSFALDEIMSCLTRSGNISRTFPKGIPKESGVKRRYSSSFSPNPSLIQDWYLRRFPKTAVQPSHAPSVHVQTHFACSSFRLMLHVLRPRKGYVDSWSSSSSILSFSHRS